MFVTPADVLAYRAMWDRYVADSVKSAEFCAQSLAGVASEQPDQATKDNLQGQADALNQWATDVWSEWNLYAGKPDSFIVLEGSQILQTFQQTVLDAGQLRQAVSTGITACPLEYVDQNGQLQKAVAGPDPSLQAQVIAHVEGLQIIGRGILQILLGTATNSLVMAGSAIEWAAGKTKDTVDALSSPWPWVAAAFLATAAVAVVYAPEIKLALSRLRPRSST